MLQRYLKPALLVLLVVAILAMAVATSRGLHYTDPFVLGRFAEFAADAPLLSTLLLLVLMPAALVGCLMPEAVVTTVAVADLGFLGGLLATLFALVAAGATACSVTRTLSHPMLRRYMAARRRQGKVLSRKSFVPVEYGVLLTAGLLVAGAPMVVTGFVLGLLGMRSKAFALAAMPFLFFRTAASGLASVEAGALTLVVLGVLGTLILLLFMYWLALMLRKRLACDRTPPTIFSEQQEGLAGQAPQANRGAQPQTLQLDLDTDPEVSGHAATLALGSVVLVCVSDEKSVDEARLVAREAAPLNVRLVHVSLDPHPASPQEHAAPRPAILGGFEGVTRVADLDEIVVRALNEGAQAMVIVQAVTPLLRRDLVREALQKLPEHGLVLGATRQQGLYLVALRREFKNSRYERGLLAGLDFGSDVGFALAGLAPHPFLLPELPSSATLRPLASVVVVCEEAGTSLAATLHRAQNGPFTEVYAGLLPGARELAGEAQELGARVLLLDSLQDLNKELGAMRGPMVVLVRDGVLLPENFDEAAWQTLRQEKCVLGGFSLPQDTPSLQRALSWLGTAIKPGTLAGPVLAQGLFLAREDLVVNGGFEAGSPDEAAALLVERLARVGRIVIHNSRVALCDLPEARLPWGRRADGADDADSTADSGRRKAARLRGKTLLSTARAQLTGQIAGLLGKWSKGQGRDANVLMAEARIMVDACDHCGRCTHVSPMLNRHKFDLSDLPDHPLIAWHCFMCGACTAACHKGIDAVDLVRTLRHAHVRSHGNRLARPGHSRTLALAFVQPYARAARPGKNVLLDADFCASFPATAQALVARLQENGIGVVLADCGASAADLGMESVWTKKMAELRRAMDEHGVTGLYTLSPQTHKFLVAMGVEVEPVYTLLHKLTVRPLRPVALTGYRMLIPCADRGRQTFSKALHPLLLGAVRDIDVPCCGGGGEAAVLEPAVARALKNAVKSCLQGSERVLTTCAGCAVTLAKAGIPVDHALSSLMGVREQACTGLGSVRALGTTLLGIARLGRAGEAAAETAPQSGGLAARLLAKIRPGDRTDQDAGTAAGTAAASAAGQGLQLNWDDPAESSLKPGEQVQVQEQAAAPEQAQESGQSRPQAQEQPQAQAQVQPQAQTQVQPQPGAEEQAPEQTQSLGTAQPADEPCAQPGAASEAEQPAEVSAAQSADQPAAEAGTATVLQSQEPAAQEEVAAAPVAAEPVAATAPVPGQEGAAPEEAAADTMAAPGTAPMEESMEAAAPMPAERPADSSNAAQALSQGQDADGADALDELSLEPAAGEQAVVQEASAAPQPDDLQKELQQTDNLQEELQEELQQPDNLPGQQPEQHHVDRPRTAVSLAGYGQKDNAEQGG